MPPRGWEGPWDASWYPEEEGNPPPEESAEGWLLYSTCHHSRRKGPRSQRKSRVYAEVPLPPLLSTATNSAHAAQPPPPVSAPHPAPLPSGSGEAWGEWAGNCLDPRQGREAKQEDPTPLATARDSARPMPQCPPSEVEDVPEGGPPPGLPSSSTVADASQRIPRYPTLPPDKVRFDRHGAAGQFPDTSPSIRRPEAAPERMPRAGATTNHGGASSSADLLPRAVTLGREGPTPGAHNTPGEASPSSAALVDDPDHYTTLGVDPDATLGVIKRAYRGLPVAGSKAPS